MVENLSKSYLELGRIQYPPVPSELVSLIGGQNIEIRILPFKGCNGALCYYDNKWMIYLNANDTLAMRRFTLFHEAFHVLAYCHTTPIFNRIGVTRGFFNEFLADVFAGSILAPNEWIKKKWVENQDVKKIGEIFEVPESFIWIRLKRLGII